MDAVLEVLDQIGLSDGEQKVYLALLELGESTSGPIAEKSGVSASKIYQVGERLVKKGLVGIVVKEGRKQFKAVHPKALLTYLKERKRDIDEMEKRAMHILPQLSSQFEEKSEKIEVQLSRGMKSLRNTFYGMIDGLGKGEEYVVIGGSMGKYANRYLPFFKHYHAERARREIKAKLLFQNTTPIIEEMEQGGEVKLLPPSFQSPLQINVHKGVTNLLLMEDEPVIFTIKSQEVANSFMQYFDELWNQEVRTLKGKEGVQSILLEALHEEEICFIGGGGYIPDRLSDWYETEYKQRALAAGHRWRNLVLPSMRGHQVIDVPFAESRFLPPGEYSPAVVYIYGETVANVLWDEEPMVFVVKNKKIASAYMQYFEALWQQEQQTWNGADAIPLLVDDVLSSGEDLYLIGATGDIVDRYPDSYQRMMNASKNGKLKRYFLSQERTRGKEFNTKYVAESAYLPDGFLSPMVIWIYGDVVSQVLWEEEITIFRIKNQKVADDYRAYYSYLRDFAAQKH
jgi:sugar-specific transcriptional regulator TrmB